ncbi:hypothetical protein EDF63_3461 [Curtobacterium sp. JUb34]|nr:hypothetical protein EDF63_3461 [Curtobacterium sp. JUb34]
MFSLKVCGWQKDGRSAGQGWEIIPAPFTVSSSRAFAAQWPFRDEESDAASAYEKR